MPATIKSAGAKGRVRPAATDSHTLRPTMPAVTAANSRVPHPTERTGSASASSKPAPSTTSRP